MQKTLTYCVYSNKSVTKQHLDALFQKLNNDPWVEFVSIKEAKLADFIFVLGGDGTFIKSLNNHFFIDQKVVGINFGTLGFYSSYKTIKQLNLKSILNKNNYSSPYVLKVVVNNEQTFYALNECSIVANETVIFDVYINNFKLETFKGSGVMFSTSSGSTGKNISLNGPIFNSLKNIYSLVEIAPVNHKYHSSLKAPLLLDNKNIIKIDKIINANKLLLAIDNRLINDIDLIKSIKVELVLSKLLIHQFDDFKSNLIKIKSSFIQNEN